MVTGYTHKIAGEVGEGPYIHERAGGGEGALMKGQERY
jgi:hypothetical protein